MVVREGVPQVEVGDTVEAGQLLVSGRIPVTGDDGAEITSHLVRADADIEAETTEEYEKKLPLVRTVRTPAGQKRRGLYLKAGPLSFTFLMPASGEKEEWDYQMEERQAKLFSNYYLPFYLGIIEGKRMVSYERAYTQQELSDLAEEARKENREKLEEKGVQILENNDKIEKSVSGYQIKGQMVVVESIVKRQPVTETPNEPEE